MQDQSSSSTTTVEANVFDLAPRGGVLGVLGVVLLVTASALAQMPHPSPAAALAAIGWLALFVADARPQRRPRRTRVFCKPGSLQIAGGAKIHARDLVGATTARHDDRVSLMLAHRGRRHRPIVLDLPDEAALATVCRALGIGHHGFGFVDMAVAPNAYSWLRLLSAAALVPFALLTFVPSDIVDLATVLAGLGFFGWLVFVLGSVTTGNPLLRLTPGGVFLPRSSWNGAFIGFDRMEDVRRDRDRLTVATKAQDGSTAAIPVQFRTSRWNRFAPTMHEVAHLESQLRAAMDRAHGKAAPERAREAFAAIIERAPGEPLRDWLARVDTIAVGAQGYRSSASASREELWSLLEDPDASPNARAAAARLLSHVAPDELRVRVADVLSTVRDERARVRIAASYDDDALHQEEQLELAEQIKPALQ